MEAATHQGMHHGLASSHSPNTDTDTFVDWAGLKLALVCWGVTLPVLMLLASRLGASPPTTPQGAGPQPGGLTTMPTATR